MKLNLKDARRLQDFYQQSLAQYGERDARSVHWNNASGQLKRFNALMAIGDLDGQSVLDVGCGTGEMYKYFLNNLVEVEYTGVDVVPDYITIAQRRFPQADFRHQDIFDMTEQFDYVLASGALSFKVEDNQEYYQQMIAHMFSLAKIGLAFNMLDKSTHTDDETFAAYDPVEIASFCSTLADGVEMITDYIPKDFTVLMYK